MADIYKNRKPQFRLNHPDSAFVIRAVDVPNHIDLSLDAPDRPSRLSLFTILLLHFILRLSESLTRGKLRDHIGVTSGGGIRERAAAPGDGRCLGRSGMSRNFTNNQHANLEAPRRFKYTHSIVFTSR